MTMILPMRGRVTRQVTGSLSGFVLTEPGPNTLICNLVFPRDNLIQDEVSPRAMPSVKLQYPSGTLTPDVVPLRAGDRVEIDGTTYELLGRARQVQSGRRVIGAECAVLPVDVLYPQEALLLNGQEVLRSDIVFAAWAPTETSSDRAGYETLQAEAPLDFVADLRPNRTLNVSGTRYHIYSASVPTNGPRVAMTLRRKDDNG